MPHSYIALWRVRAVLHFNSLRPWNNPVVIATPYGDFGGGGICKGIKPS